MPTYAIGDVQGCYSALQNLLSKIDFQPVRDTLWFTGDLINRGYESLQVLRFVKSLGERAVTVLGNHDLHFLAVATDATFIRDKDTFIDILQAPEHDELCHWLRHRPLLYYNKALDYVLVHAGIPPQWDLKSALGYAKEVETALQGESYRDYLKHIYGINPAKWDESLQSWERLRLITNYFTRMRFCDRYGTLELKAKGDTPPRSDLYPWFKAPNRRTQTLKIIFGHWAALNGITKEPNIFALDTGCIWGNCLTAMCLETGQRFYVNCNSI